MPYSRRRQMRWWPAMVATALLCAAWPVAALAQECSENFKAAFYAQSGHLSPTTRIDTCASSDLGECKRYNSRIYGFTSDMSSLTWSENAVLAVYDEESCGGNSLLVYSAGPYKKVLDDGNTRTQGFAAGVIDDLSKVCKHDRCGYDSYAGAPFGGVLQANNNGSCKCVETWNDCVRSFRMFKRAPLDKSKNVP